MDAAKTESVRLHAHRHQDLHYGGSAAAEKHYRQHATLPSWARSRPLQNEQFSD